MSREKLYLNGEDSEGRGNVLTTSLDFVRKVNNNTKEIVSDKGYRHILLDLDTHNTPEHIAKALVNCSGVGGYSTPSYSEDNSIEGIVPDYNKNISDNDSNYQYYTVNCNYYIDDRLKFKEVYIIRIDNCILLNFNLADKNLYFSGVYSEGLHYAVQYISKNREDFSFKIGVFTDMSIDVKLSSKPVEIPLFIELTPNNPILINYLNPKTNKYISRTQCTLNYNEYNVLEQGAVLLSGYKGEDVGEFTLESVSSGSKYRKSVNASGNYNYYITGFNMCKEEQKDIKLPFANRAYAILEHPETKEQVTLYSSKLSILYKEQVTHYNE